MKTFAVLALATASLVCAAGDVTWETRLTAAQQRAKAEHKLIFMDVYTDWCGWCIKLQRETFPSPEVQAALAKLVPLQVKTQLANGRPASPEGKEVESQFGVQSYPTLIILDAEGKELRRHSGYLPPRELAEWINAAKKN